tara:strand:- start:129 stop:362 length:234 start_codon:yes stop_codon:yes gene_type:complete
VALVAAPVALVAAAEELAAAAVAEAAAATAVVPSKYAARALVSVWNVGMAPRKASASLAKLVGSCLLGGVGSADIGG